MSQQQAYCNSQAEMNTRQGLVYQPLYQPWAMGGGQWVMPKVVRLSDGDIERIAAAVVRALREDVPTVEGEG